VIGNVKSGGAQVQHGFAKFFVPVVVIPSAARDLFFDAPTNGNAEGHVTTERRYYVYIMASRSRTATRAWPIASAEE